MVLAVHIKGLDKNVGKINSYSFGIFVPGIEWYMTPLFSQSFQISMSALATQMVVITFALTRLDPIIADVGVGTDWLLMDVPVKVTID